jgi:small subunit ribosomal protein S1
MDQVTQDPEAHAAARHGGGAGTGASPWEVGDGPMAARDGKAGVRPIAGGSAPEAGQEDFEDIYQQSLQDLQEGEVVRGTIVGLKGSEVLVDVGYKSEGTIPIDEFHRSGITPEVGLEIEVYLEAKEDNEGLIVLSKEKADKIKVWDVITRAYEKGAPVDGRVVEVVKGGLAVDVGVKAFLPGSQVDLRPVKNLNSMIGQNIKARVIKFNRRRGNVVLSRRVVLEEEREEKRKHTLTVLQEGMVTTGVVKNITDYGAFIDLGGVDGLLHITDMSWGRISHPSELVQVGDKLEVVVLHFDRESGRVSLGHKQKGPDPWDAVEEQFAVNSRHKGKIVSLTNYGAFVELDRGIEGLVHVSEMSWTRRVRHPSKIVNVGDEVEVMVLAVDKGQKRISLGMKQVEVDPWDSIEERFRPGMKVQGKVRNLTDFGAFVEIEPGIDGLLHISDMTWARNVAHPSELLKKGQPIETVILHVDKENKRISLGLKQLQRDPWEDVTRKFPVGANVKGKVVRLTEFGAFVELEAGVDGLLHISQMSSRPVTRAEDVVQLGDELTVKVIRIEPNERRIGLSLRDLAADMVVVEEEEGGGRGRRGGRKGRDRDKYDSDDDE